MFVEVESNPNCEQSICARFKEAGPARSVVQIKVFERKPEGEWCWVTGWGDDIDQPCCPAQAQLVEDSGAGLSYLIFGGLGGIRLKPISVVEEWNITSAEQWGEPYLLLADARDIRYAESDSTDR